MIVVLRLPETGGDSFSSGPSSRCTFGIKRENGQGESPVPDRISVVGKSIHRLVSDRFEVCYLVELVETIRLGSQGCR